MEKVEIEARIKKSVAMVLKREEDSIETGANFIFDLGADSMESLQLIAAFEEEFGIDMEEDEALNVQTVAEAINFIKATIEKQE